MLTAITRAVSPSLASCELTFLPRQPIDLAKAIAQHEAYQERLTQLGLRVMRLPAEPALPDAVFVEDAAVVVDEVAVIARMGAASRRPEVESLAAALSRHRPLKFLQAPATLDGGDVLRIGRTLYVGVGARTNREGVASLRALLEPDGYRVHAVAAPGCLHLKTGCTYLGRNMLLANPAWVGLEPFQDCEIIGVPDAEPWAANTLTIGEVTLLPDSFPQTRALLERRGFPVQTVDTSELQKAEAGLTCLSLIFESREPKPDEVRQPG